MTITREFKLLTAGVLFLSYAYFYPGRGWNQNVRFDLTRSLVEQHTVRIDSFQENAGRDKSLFRGHYYCDKAPGLSFAAVPVWAVVRGVMRTAEKDPSSEDAARWGLYIATLFTVTLPTILALSLLFSIAVEMGASPGAAAFGTLALGLGTPIWCYANIFWGHAAAGAFLVFAFAAAWALGRPGCSHPIWLAFLVGLAGGFATLIEYPAGPAAALVAGYALLRAWGGGKRLRVSGSILVGALACIVILCAYDLVAFGSVSAISYQYNPDTTQLMKRGLLGVTFPQPSVLYQLLFNLSQGHGLLPLAPVLLGALPGLILMWKRNLKREALLFAAVPLYYLFFNSAYQDWTGGSTYGPRYLSAGLLFLGPPLAISWASGSRRLRALLAVLAIAGFALALIAESTYPMPGKEYTYPLMHLVRGFLSGQVPMTYVYSVPTDASNAGRFLGLHGIWSLTPLFVLWIAAALLVWILMEPRPVFRRALTQLSSLL